MKTSRLATTFALSALGAVLVPAALGAATLNVTSSADDGSPGTLRYVLKFANEGDVIQIPATTIVLTTAGSAALDTDGDEDLDVKKSVTIQGVDSVSTIIDGGGLDRIFDVDTEDDGAAVTIKGMTIQNGNAPAEGGGIRVPNAGFARIENVLLTGNTAATYGGAVATEGDGGEAIIINSQLTHNKTLANDGGAIQFDCSSNWSSGVVVGSLIADNESAGAGGGLVVFCGNVDISDTQFRDNTAAGVGGGVYNDYGAMTIRNSEFTGNTADGGGGIYNDYNTYIENSVISDNKAVNNTDGGGIFTSDQMLILTSTISGNTAEDEGGGIFNNESLVADAITISDNVSDVDQDDSGDGGGGIFNDFSLTLTNSVVSGNTANNRNGGGIYNSDFATLINVAILGNTAIGGDSSTSTPEGGGGLFSTGDNALVKSSTISNNRAVTDNDGSDDDPAGGGVIATDPASFENTTISGNSADGHGGGIYNDTGITLTNVTITGNIADANEGGDSGGDGGGLYNSTTSTGEVLLLNSIIAGNTDASAGGEAPDCFNDFPGSHGIIHVAGPNIVQNLTGCDLEGFADQAQQVDPLFDTAGLADNGDVDVGDTDAPQALQTISLQSGSPAIDAGDDTTCAPADENGVERPVGDHCDLGAVETAGGGGTTGGGTTGGETTGGTTTGGTGGDSGGGCSLIR